MNLKSRLRQFVKSTLPRWIMIYKLKNDNSDILLTFDDGPDPLWTPKILDTLKDKNKKAIFYIIGIKAEKHPDIVKRIHDEGHIIGNHTHTHPHDRPTTILEYRNDIKRAQEIIKSILGFQPKTFRPPCGEFSLKTFLSAKSLGLKIVLMSNRGGEWNENKNSNPIQIENDILNKIEKGQIIVLHDNNDKISVILGSLIDRIEALKLHVATKILEEQL